MMQQHRIHYWSVSSRRHTNGRLLQVGLNRRWPSSLTLRSLPQIGVDFCHLADGLSILRVRARDRAIGRIPTTNEVADSGSIDVWRDVDIGHYAVLALQLINDRVRTPLPVYNFMTIRALYRLFVETSEYFLRSSTTGH
jgi:hypothetical protein